MTLDRLARTFANLTAVAALGVAVLAFAQGSPLPPDRAFRFSAALIDSRTIEARFTIAEGYYLYRDKIHFAVEPATAGLTVPPLPEGKVKEDQFFGRVETQYRLDFASPEDSLSLSKPAAAVPHAGGQVFRPGEAYYQVVRDWIAGG